jgi:hypothetical protein
MFCLLWPIVKINASASEANLSVKPCRRKPEKEAETINTKKLAQTVA